MNIPFSLILSLPLFCGLIHPVASGQTAPATKPDVRLIERKLIAKLQALHEEVPFPGATVAFVLPDGHTGTVSVGMADREAKRALKPSDRMLAGSIGKTYVSAVALQLLQEKKIDDLDAPISRWLGKEVWFSRIPNAADITLRMLMNHSSGIPEHILDPAFTAALQANPDRVWKPEELIAYVLDKKPLFPAGKGWSYADTNYILVGMIVERVAGRTLYEEVQRRLLKPLHLDKTSPSTSRTLPGLITGYASANSPFGKTGAVMTDGKFFINPQFEWTGGGFVSNAQDLAKWAQALYGEEVLRKTTREQLLAGVPARTGRGDKYGLGVQIRQSDWGESYGHGGWFPGYLSEMEYFPSKKTAIAIQFNTDDLRLLKRMPHAYLLELARVIFEETGG